MRQHKTTQHSTRLLCVMLSAAMLFTVADFTVLAAETGLEAAGIIEAAQEQEEGSVSANDGQNGKETPNPAEEKQDKEAAEPPEDKESASENDVDKGTVSENDVNQGIISVNALEEVQSVNGDQSNAVYEYKADEDKHEATITKYNGSAASLEIPSTIDGYTVVGIDNSVFKDNTQLRAVVIPDSVIEIGCYAFDGCTQLSSVKLSKNLINLRFSAFRDCDSLRSVEIPKSLERSDDNPNYPTRNGAFNNCDNLKEVTFEEGTTEVAENLFAHCTGLETITIPDTVTTIEAGAFSECSNLVSVILSSSATEIGNSAFEKCISMEEIVIPDSVIEIGCYAFDGCTQLSSVKLSKNLINLRFSAFRDCDSLRSVEIPKSLERSDDNPNYPTRNGAFNNCDNLKEVTFEEGTTEIAENLFAYCIGLKTITLPDTVTMIEAEAFSECKNLKEIKMSANIIQIEYKAFKNCTSLTQMIIPQSTAKIGNYAFQGCSSLIEITIPTGVNDMGTSLFDGCSNLEKAILQNEFTVVPSNCFKDCFKLQSVELPDSYTTIEYNAFQNCKALSSITWPKELLTIETRAFENTALETVELPDKLTTVGNYAFYNSDLLVSITFPDSVISLGTYVLSNCEKLSNVQLGTGLTEIPKYAFDLCPSLAKIILPYRITTVGNNAFSNCTKLTEITIPRAVTSIGTNAVSYPTRMTVYGISGTYAETWAKSVGAAFVAKEVKAEKVTLGQEAVTVNRGQKVTLVMTVTPQDFTDEVVWRSTDEKIATVDDKGVVAGKAMGEATISVLVGDVGASCKVTVVQPVTGISLNKATLSLDAFGSETLTATVNPSTAYNKAVVWGSSDETIAVVDQNGLVTALAKGEAVITVTAQDGSGVSRTCKVTVTGNGYRCSAVSELESPHNYPVNCNDVWLYTKEGAEKLFVVFDERTEVESGFDYLYIYDEKGTQIGKYTGTDLAGKTVEIGGDTVKIKLVSDKAGVKWGFKVTDVRTEKGEPDPDDPDDPDMPDPDGQEEVLPEDIPAGGIPQGLWISAIGEQEYTGKAIKPEVRVYHGNKRLKAGKDYTLGYKNNVQAAQAFGVKAPAVTVKGKGNYSGTETVEFVIKNKNISDTDVTKTFADAYALPTNQSDPKLVFSAKYYNKTLKKDKDYTLTVKNSSGMPVYSYSAKGTYKLVVDGKGNFTGSEELTFEVSDKIPVSNLKAAKITPLEYTGKALMPKPVVKDKGAVLTEGTDYSLAYRNNVEAGSASVLITGKGNYLGTLAVPFTIVGRPMKKVKVNSFTKAYAYTGEAVRQSQSMTLTYGENEERLTEGVDYWMEYSSNVNTGTAAVTFTGMGKYTGVLKKTYKITAYRFDLDAENRIKWQEDINIAYCKGGALPHIKLYDGKKLLVEGTDYTLSYKNNKAVATASAEKRPEIIVKGKGNYSGVWTRIIPFTIAAKNIAKVTAAPPDIALNSKPGKWKSTPVLTDTDGKKLNAGKDYSKNYRYTYQDDTRVTDTHLNSQVLRKAGEAVGEADIVPVNTVLCVSVDAAAGGNYTGTVTAAYRIVRTPINKARIIVRNPETGNKNLFAYTSKEITIKKENLTVTVGGVELSQNQYEILGNTYQNNRNKGTASVQIKGLGDYGGTATVKFKIGTKGFRWFYR